MSRNFNRALVALVLVLGAGGAQATNVVVNSEQRAAASALTYFRLGDEVPAGLAGLTYSAKDYTDRTLRFLEAVHTPATVRRARNGVIVACPISGSFTAKLSRTGSVLDIEWNNCGFEISGAAHFLTGPGRIDLCADDFTPATVSDLRVGNATRDLVERFLINGVPTGPENETRRNLRLSGAIAFGRPTPDYTFDGQSSLLLTGFSRHLNTSTVAGPDNTVVTTESRITANGLRLTSDSRHDDLVSKDDIRFELGTLTIWQRTSPYGDQPEWVTSTSIKASGLRVLNSSDYQLGTDTLLVHGGAFYARSTNSGSACSNGGYDFKTRLAPRHPAEFSSFDAYDAGDILINGTVGLKLSASGQPEDVGVMHVELRVPGVGTFGYDGNSVWEALSAAAQCPN